MKLILLILGIALCSPPISAQSLADSISAIAENGLQIWLNSAIPPSEYKSFNINSDESITDALPCRPLQVQVLTPQAAANWREGTALDAIIVPSTRWFVPMSIEGKVRFLLAVSDLGKGFTRCAVGFSPLAAALDSAEKAWPNTSLRLIAVPQTGRYFFSVEGLGTDNLTPLGPVSPADAGTAALAKESAGTLRAAMDLVGRESARRGGGAQ